MAVVSMKQLLEAGVHFGHQTRRWNPKMAKYIFTERNGIYIIDLQKTVKKLDEAYNYVKEVAAEGGDILFVGTKKQAQESIRDEALRCGMHYVNARWLGGMLTNFRTIRKRIDRMDQLAKMKENGTLSMFCIGSIRKAELTVGGRLVHKGIQKFPQVFFRCIIQRSQDADGGQAAVCRRFAGHFGPLGFQHLFGGQIAGTLAKAAALDKARAPFEHGGQALVLRQLHRIACQFSGAFQSYIHIRPRRAALPCRPRKPLPYRRSFSGGRGSAMPPCCTCARSAQWSETPE